MVEITEGETYVRVCAGPASSSTAEGKINDIIRAEESEGSELPQIHATSSYVLLEFFKPLITLEEFMSREWTPNELLEIYLGLNLQALDLYAHILNEKSAIKDWIKDRIRGVLLNG